MPSAKASFFDLQSYAVVGNSRTKGFPMITYDNLRRRNKKVYPVDIGGHATIAGDAAYGSVSDLPETVEAAIVELPRYATMEAVKQVADAGIKNVWLHQRSDSDAVLRYCQDKGLRVHTGGCAVMYTNDRLSYHTVHKNLWKMLGKY